MESLLSAGSIQAGQFFVQPRPTRLAPLITGAIETVRPLIEPRKQQVTWRRTGAGLRVVADAGPIGQVLFNLLSNASKYSRDGSVIHVHAARIDGQVRIAVEDHGPGIPPEQQVGLFERFYRVRAGNSAPGIGLGLAIVRGIIEAHGGTVGVDSRLGAGTTVWFTLPAAGRRQA